MYGYTNLRQQRWVDYPEWRIRLNIFMREFTLGQKLTWMAIGSVMTFIAYLAVMGGGS